MNLETVGTDIEVFLKAEDVIISAEGKIRGSKDDPKFLEREVSLQEDNVMAEMNVKPAESSDELVENVNDAFFQLKDHTSYDVDLKASHEFSQNALSSEQALEFGCDPEKDAYGVEPEDPDPFNPLRSCGGHIHIGYIGMEDTKEEIKRSRIILTKLLDLYIGIPFVIIGDSSDRERSEMYGAPGRFRGKKYGLEYRTPSNFWIRDSKRIEATFNNVQKAVDHLIEFMGEDNSTEPFSSYDSKRIYEAILYFDKELAKEIANDFNLKYQPNVKKTDAIQTKSTY